MMPITVKKTKDTKKVTDAVLFGEEDEAFQNAVQDAIAKDQKKPKKKRIKAIDVNDPKRVQYLSDMCNQMLDNGQTRWAKGQDFTPDELVQMTYAYAATKPKDKTWKKVAGLDADQIKEAMGTATKLTGALWSISQHY